MPVEAALPVARSFAHFLNLANIAEQHHRVRRRRASSASPAAGRSRRRSRRRCRGSSRRLSPDALYAAVFACDRARHHRPPDRDHAPDAPAQVHGDCDGARRARPAGSHRRRRETLIERCGARSRRVGNRGSAPRAPVAARRGAIGDGGVRGNALGRGAEFCRSLDRTLRRVTGRGLPLDAAPIRFGSWIGGDRDGNPFVTPEVTRRACLMARWTA